MADPTEAAVEETPAEFTSNSPWANDIRQAFSDPQVAATVDAFMRSKYQPRMTQLEQQIAQAEQAKQLWDSFQEDPAATYAQITRELWGDEAAQAAFAALENGQTPATNGTVEQTPAQESVAAPAPLDPRMEAMLNDWERQRELEAYDAEIAKITADPTNADIDPDLIHTFVAAAEGDFNEAIQRYRAFAADFLTKYGLTPAEANAQTQTAPAVMGSEAGGAGGDVPVQPKYVGQSGLHQAIEDTVAQMKRNVEAPPVS